VHVAFPAEAGPHLAGRKIDLVHGWLQFVKNKNWPMKIKKSRAMYLNKVDGKVMLTKRQHLPNTGRRTTIAAASLMAIRNIVPVPGISA